MTANPKKFVAIPIGVDSINFQPKPKNKSLLEKYGISKDSKVIIFVGALDKAHYFKGVENLITAVASLRDVTYEWHLLVVGAGELLSSYRDLASQLHLSGRISFAGYVPDKDLADHFNLAELAILPSIDKSEAFGTVLLEAMSCGKSVIGSDLPGVRTVVEHEINGLVVKPGNPDDIAKKINVLFQDDSLRNRFGQAGRKKVLELYDWAKVVSQIDKIYQQVKV
ncbi:hypothetical protein CL634_01690 [bacterium]|nr:hypothetical protein [bacterium]